MSDHTMADIGPSQELQNTDGLSAYKGEEENNGKDIKKQGEQGFKEIQPSNGPWIPTAATGKDVKEENKKCLEEDQEDQPLKEQSIPAAVQNL